MIARAEHLDWSKQRAREFCERGDPDKAVLSLASDLEKHPGTAGNHGAKLSLVLQRMAGKLSSRAEVLEYIDNYK